jgi:hypothetical protein
MQSSGRFVSQLNKMTRVQKRIANIFVAVARKLVYLVLKPIIIMKHSQWIGVIALILLVSSCFFPWTYYPDLEKTFTGFFSENNLYGKPGKVFIVLASLALVLFLLNRVWAKRLNFFVCALIVAYAFRTFIIFSACYRGICPEKKVGLWMMIAAAILSLAMAITPDMKVTNKRTA